MNTIELTKTRLGDKNIYQPTAVKDFFLSKHCLGHVISALTDAEVNELKFIAEAHGWKVAVL